MTNFHGKEFLWFSQLYFTPGSILLVVKNKKRQKNPKQQQQNKETKPKNNNKKQAKTNNIFFSLLHTVLKSTVQEINAPVWRPAKEH